MSANFNPLDQGLTTSVTAAPADGTQPLPYALYLTEPGDSSAVSVDDINQGQIGDCFLLAAMGEIAFYDPSAITNMIKDDGNGTYTVTLYSAPQGQSLGIPSYFTTAPQTVTVGNISPSSVNSQPNADVVNGQKEIWPQIIEEAYAQANGGYSAINDGGFPWIAMEELTGMDPANILPSITSSQLIQYRAANDLIVFDTPSSSSLGYGLVGDHAYLFEGLQTVNTVTYVDLGNPWGFDQPAAIPISDLAGNFDEVDVGQIGQPVLTPPPPAPSGITLHVSEDAFQGDAQFTVSIDGVTIATAGSSSPEIFTATLPHASGQSQEINLPGTYNVSTTHTVTISFINDLYYGTPQTDRNLYVDSIYFNGTNTLESAALLGNGSRDFTIGANSSGSSPIILNVSEDAFQGDAQFTVSVDGVQQSQVYTATAIHGNGASQAITLAGQYASGPHTVVVDFINDLYYGTPQTDRNLYVDAISFNGTTTKENTALLGNGPQSFTIGANNSVGSSIVLNVSEDAYQGDAQFTVNVDGVQQSRVYTATVLHGSPAGSQAITLAGTYAAGPHTVVVDFINDLYAGTPQTDRNLYVDSISFDGTITKENTALYSNGQVSFTIQPVAPGSTSAIQTQSENTTGVPADVAGQVLNGAGTISLLKDATVTDTGGGVTYKFAAGDGAVTLNNSEASQNSAAQQVDFAGNVTDDALWFSKIGNDLVVDVLGTKDQLTLTGFYSNPSVQSEIGQFDAGSLRLDQQLGTLVQAMASFTGSHSDFNPSTTNHISLNDAYFGSSLATAASTSWHA